MSRTVGDVIDRVFRDWLYPVDDQPSRVILDGAITAGATSITYLDTYLLVEEEFLLSPGQLIEIDTELMMVGTVDATSNTITVRRGMSGTTAAAHDDASLVTVAPLYSRAAVFDAVRSTVSRLYPRLYQRKAAQVTSGQSAEIPHEARVLEGFWYFEDSRLKTVPVQAFDYPDAATERLLLFGCDPNVTGYLMYRAPFTLPTVETDDLETNLGLNPEYEDLLVYSAASSLVASRDFGATTPETLHKQLGAELFPIGSAIRIRRELKMMYEELLEELSVNLRSQNGVPVSVHGWT